MRKTLVELINRLTALTGNPFVFAAFIALIVGWFVAGIFFRYSSTWFDIMDVFVFLTTFLLVFIVQATQNADTKAMQDKLDEIIESLPKANDHVENEEKRLKKGKRK